MKPLSRAFAGLALLALAGCGLDSEDKLRARLDGWVSLGETVYFASTRECTAAVFELTSAEIKSAVPLTSSVAEGLNWLQRGKRVGFDVAGSSPTAISEYAMSLDLPVGLGVLSAGVAAGKCMTEAVQGRYLDALTDPRAVLIFDPEDNVLAVIDRRARQVFFARGNV